MVAIIFAAVLPQQAPAAATSSWVVTESLSAARYHHTATLLPDGRVLVAGGWDEGSLSGAELYDPDNDTWAAVASMNTSRNSHGAVLLPNGRVLVFGGKDASGSRISSAEVYNPDNDTWTAAAGMNHTRASFTSTLLGNGLVLAAGGIDASSDFLCEAELYNPALNAWVETDNMTTPRSSHAAALLPDGKVLVTGGSSGSGSYLLSSEIYNPGTGHWSAAAARPVNGESLRASLLGNGKVLVTGGYYSSGNRDNADLYNYDNDTWKAGTMSVVRSSHTSTLLNDGRVLISGGYGAGSSFLDSAELYDPAAGTWAIGPTMSDTRFGHTATLLDDGRVLVAGGYNDTESIDGAEYFALYQQLDAAKAGTGSGTVVSDPAGIDCGSTCSADFLQDAEVSLTATPAGGSLFAGWSGDCSGTGTCIVTMDEAASVTATFNLIPSTSTTSVATTTSSAPSTTTTSVDNSTTTTTVVPTTSTTSVVTTTSIAPSTTTTTADKPGPCPAQKVLGADDPGISQLRDFRDSTLAGSALGRRIIGLYYDNADSINAALDRSPALRSLARRIFKAIVVRMEAKN